MISFTKNDRKKQIHRDGKQINGSRGGEENRMAADGPDVSFWDDENVLELDSGHGCIAL